MSTNDSAEVRWVSDNDIDALLRIEKQAFSDPWTRGMIEKEIEPRGVNHGLVLEKSGSVLGYCFYWLFPGDEAQILNLAVDSSTRRQGVASRLLARVITHAVEQKAARVFLEVRVSNVMALRFYQAHGFEGIGRRREYYSNPVEDALLFSKALSSEHTIVPD